MHEIPKKIVTDEDARPIAVQIDYADWLEIERLLSESNGGGTRNNPATPERTFRPVRIKGGPISDDIIRDRR